MEPLNKNKRRYKKARMVKPSTYRFNVRMKEKVYKTTIKSKEEN
jgi:hypothetical protein